MFGTTPFPRPYLAPFAPYFSLESRYRCAIKQRDEGSWTKTRHGIVLCWCEPVNGEPLLGRRPTSTRLHRLRKRKWMVDGPDGCVHGRILHADFANALLLPTPSLAVQCLCLTYSPNVPTLPTHTLTYTRSLTSVLFLGGHLLEGPGARVPGGSSN